MLGDRDAQVLSQHAVAFNVFLFDGAFPDRDLGVLLKSLAKWPDDGRVESEVVEVKVQQKVVGDGFGKSLYLVFEIEPRPRLRFESRVPACGGFFAFADPVFGRHVDRPPADVGVGSNLLAQQRPDRSIH